MYQKQETAAGINPSSARVFSKLTHAAEVPLVSPEGTAGAWLQLSKTAAAAAAAAAEWQSNKQPAAERSIAGSVMGLQQQLCQAKAALRSRAALF